MANNIKKYLATLNQAGQLEQAEALLSYMQSDIYILQKERHPEDRYYKDPHTDILSSIIDYLKDTKHPKAQEIEFKKTIVATHNMAKNEIDNRRTKDKKDFIMAHLLSGTEIEIPLKNVYSYLDLMEAARKVLNNKKIKIILNNKCLCGSSPYAIFTDDTILNIIILNKY